MQARTAIIDFETSVSYHQPEAVDLFLSENGNPQLICTIYSRHIIAAEA
jgi:hypothetical protein